MNVLKVKISLWPIQDAAEESSSTNWQMQFPYYSFHICKSKWKIFQLISFDLISFHFPLLIRNSSKFHEAIQHFKLKCDISNLFCLLLIIWFCCVTLLHSFGWIHFEEQHASVQFVWLHFLSFSLNGVLHSFKPSWPNAKCKL